MKMVSAVALCLSLIAGAAFAADTPSPAAATTTSATSKSCDKEASAKKLHGDARAKFIKECMAGKHTS